VRRADGLLLVVVGAFGAFVATQLADRWTSAGPQRVVELADADGGYNLPKQRQPEQTLQPDDYQRADVASTVVSTGVSPTPLPAKRDAEDVLSRINSATDTYMPDMLLDLHGVLIRWPDHREQALRVWVQSGTDIRDWDLRYAQVAREAFADWASDDVPLRFDFVIDSATSDVHISWIDKFPPSDGMRVGFTKRITDRNGWIVNTDIVVAVHDSAGTMIRPWDIAGIVRHEAGHALGLGHSRDPHTKMFPTEMVHDISPSDRATLRLLYQLSPGAVK
jgi:Matrixin